MTRGKYAYLCGLGCDFGLWFLQWVKTRVPFGVE